MGSAGKIFATTLLHMGKILINVMLIYRHRIIMAYSEKLSDFIILEKCEIYSTQKKPI